MHILRGTWLLILLAVLSGCDNTPDTAHPLSYNKNGITFSYPGNWTVTEEGVNEAMRYVIVEGPGNGLFLAQIYPKDDALDIAAFAEWFSAESNQSLPVGKVDKVSFAVSERRFGAKTLSGIKEEFAVVLLGERVPHVREYYAERSADSIAFMVSQSSTEDGPTVGPALSQILASFTSRAVK